MIAWIVFFGIVIALILADLGIFNKKDEVIPLSKSLWLSLFYIVIALLFGLGIWKTFGLQQMSEYYTGYLVEKSLSLDNLFVISLIFSSLKIPREYQHRVLFFGILGVIILRGIFIGIGAVLVSSFSWILYIFSLFLMLVGIKMFFTKEKEEKQAINLAEKPLLKYLQRHFRISPELHGHAFFTRLPDKNNSKRKLLALTPLMIALILIEGADIIFAVDSIPAIFTITNNIYIVYTSNIFAILGLRSLYFALDALLARFIYLKYALGLILVFIGSKIFIAHGLGIEKFPASISLGITVLLLTGGIVLSLWRTKNGHTKTAT